MNWSARSYGLFQQIPFTYHRPVRQEEPVYMVGRHRSLSHTELQYRCEEAAGKALAQPGLQEFIRDELARLNHDWNQLTEYRLQRIASEAAFYGAGVSQQFDFGRRHVPGVGGSAEDHAS